jgi:serine protease AprX
VFNLSSGLCLDLAGGASANGTKVVLNTCGTTANQRWTGTFAQTLQLVNPASGRCLEVPTTTPANGTMLDIATCGTGSNQRFTFPLGDDAMSTFSSGGDGSRNADVSAPGQSIAGLRAPGSYVDATYASTGAVGTRFFRGSGTSQATAFVSGLVALQLQRRPSATPDDIKSELKGLAVPLKDVEPRIQGSGSVDASKLLSRGTASAPAQTWSRSAGYGAGNALQNARGSMSLSMDNVVLSGERDIFGKAFDAQAMASSRWTGSSWSGGTWNGSAWSGSSWSGSSWSGSSWSGSSWSGSRWTAQSWSANVWDGSRWTGSSWSGSTWSGSSWSGSTWSNTLWGR